jgi:hypothetical protein
LKSQEKVFGRIWCLQTTICCFLADPVVVPCVQSSRTHAPPPHRVHMQNLKFTPAELAHRRFGHTGRSAAEELLKRNLLPPEAIMRYNRGVPPPRFDGSAAGVTASR